MRSIEDWEGAWDDYSFDLEELVDSGDCVVGNPAHDRDRQKKRAEA